MGAHYYFNLDPYTDELTVFRKEIALKRYEDSLAIMTMYGSRVRGRFDPNIDL